MITFMRSTILFLAAILIGPGAYGAGIPIIDGAAVQQAIQDEIKSRIAKERREMMAKVEQKLGIDIWEDEESAANNNAANVTTRLTDAVSQIHNKRSDASTAPYMDACGGVSVARSNAASRFRDAYTNMLPKKIGAFTRSDRNQGVTAAIDSYVSYQGDNPGAARRQAAKAVRDYESQRFAALDQALIEISSEPSGFTRLFDPVVPDMPTKERTDFIRTMLIGDGSSPSSLNAPISMVNGTIRNREMVEDGVYMAVRDTKTLGAYFDNRQTAVEEDKFLPLEAAIAAAADPKSEIQFAIASGTSPTMMVDRAMLQRWALTKSAKLAAMLQDYRRNQVVLMQLVLMLSQSEV